MLTTIEFECWAGQYRGWQGNLANALFSFWDVYFSFNSW